MSTIPTINSGHFDHGNLNEGHRHGVDDAILEELLAAAKVDIEALENAFAAPTLTPAAEVADVVAIAFASPVASVEQYVAEVYDPNMEVNDAVFTMAETGVGSEIAGSGKARLIFKTDAAGAATVSVTDVAGASGATVYVAIRPLLESGDVAQACAPVMVSITFD